MKAWEEIYRGYVIWDNKIRFYVVVNDPCVAGVALRRHASRFTKEAALNYINKVEGDFSVEDAI